MAGTIDAVAPALIGDKRETRQLRFQQLNRRSNMWFGRNYGLATSLWMVERRKDGARERTGKRERGRERERE